MKQAADYYSENYGDYELQNSPNKLNFYLDLVSRHVAPNVPLFELGVGQGNFLAAASKKYVVAGCDVNEFGVVETRRKVPQATVLVGSVEAIPADSPLPAVVSFDVLEHLPHLPEALSEIYKKLSPDGFLIGVVPVYDGPLGWLVHLLDNDPTHLTKVSRAAWIKMLEEAGFRIVEQGGILRKLFAKKYIHLTKPQTILRKAGVAYYFVAKKPKNSSH